ncbi:hypothetical protein JI56_03490 [SAR11 cluster bacterium PRT-SC02]|nr:hypothetical protein JI56_03490 [SAR11 cluster bacterium PRT-SC02]
MIKKIVIVSNEKFYDSDGNFSCDNIAEKSLPDELKKKFQIEIIGRKSKFKRAHNLETKKIETYTNIFSYIQKIFDERKDNNSIYLVLSISPFTFLSVFILSLFKKKIFTYLRSNGYEEYKKIIGSIGPKIYNLMFNYTAKKSILISCRKHILMKKKGFVVEPSELDDNWLRNISEKNIKDFKLLYVGRVKVEKGVFSLDNLLQSLNENLSLTIVGSDKNHKKLKYKNTKIYPIEKDQKKLINFYDECNIFILPSFTEGHPMALLEALSRLRPVIIFKDIEHIIGEKKGIFAVERNEKSLLKILYFIRENYNSIQQEMKKNILPNKKDFINNLSKIVSGEIF